MKFTTIESLDIKEIVDSEYINWTKFDNSTVLVTGATGLIGSQIVNSILIANQTKNTNIKVLALVRNLNKAKAMFSQNNHLEFVVQDISTPINYNNQIDYIIHTANGTASKEFVETPVETIDSIVIGTKNILEFAKKQNIKSLVYLSSMEVYGKTDFNRIEPLSEEDYGYIDILQVRSSYPEGKRLAEAFCKAYASEYNLPVKIARLVQTIGAGVDINDNRVFAQFAKNAINKKDIVLHTKGDSIRSYCYITDAITGIFTILERGLSGECYNVANEATTMSIKEMAELVSKNYPESKLKIELNEDFYPPASKLHVSTKKLENLNWKAKIDLQEMYKRLTENFKIKTGK